MANLIREFFRYPPSKGFPRRFRTWHLAVPLLLILFQLVGSIQHAEKSAAQSESASVFLIKPFIQLGDEPDLRKSETLEVVWLSLGKNNDANENWQVDFDAIKNSKWKNGKIDSKQMGFIGGAPYFRHTAKVTDLKPGQPFSYRVLKYGKAVFQSEGVARKAFDQPYRFAVVGDIGAGTNGQRRVAYQMAKKKPDFLVIPGDIVYDRGLVSEYLARFFPILNSDSNSPSAGAQLLRSTLTMAAIGNHDIALTNAWEGVDLTRFPDALAYYLLWSMPLDGPNKIVNSKNTTRIVGSAANQIGFAKAAGKRFPVMANYSFDYGNSHWVILDGNSYMDWTDKKLRQWLDDDLAKAGKATWKFASFHQPGFSVDESHADEQRMRLVSDIFEKHKVDIVFAGHAHCYQRTYPLKFKTDLTKLQGPFHDAVAGSFTLDKSFDGKSHTSPNGVIYVVTGGGGANLYQEGVAARTAPFLYKYVYSHSFTLCDVSDKTLRLTQVSADGKVLDQFDLTKGAPEPLKVGNEVKPTSMVETVLPLKGTTRARIDGKQK